MTRYLTIPSPLFLRGERVFLRPRGTQRIPRLITVSGNGNESKSQRGPITQSRAGTRSVTAGRSDEDRIDSKLNGNYYRLASRRFRQPEEWRTIARMASQSRPYTQMPTRRTLLDPLINTRSVPPLKCLSTKTAPQIRGDKRFPILQKLLWELNGSRVSRESTVPLNRGEGKERTGAREKREPEPNAD
ncbi:unnamed protein product [Xylocopa violacea]|uniref:Uncharacterized protein n=1 Tax=Xylocopa violacea TaxID=135666 RepID=A0ABP1N905_XYLVO